MKELEEFKVLPFTEHEKFIQLKASWLKLAHVIATFAT
jgi:hypothetical protein